MREKVRPTIEFCMQIVRDKRSHESLEICKDTRQVKSLLLEFRGFLLSGPSFVSVLHNEKRKHDFKHALAVRNVVLIAIEFDYTLDIVD